MDGGYYAIKGFEYQIDKTLSEVLFSSNDESVIGIEQIQDVNNGDYVIQVKYKEAAKLTPSAIRKPIIQLINEFILDKSRNYILYCYFFDTNGYTENVSIDLLETILGKEKDKFDGTVKNSFLSKFNLCFSETFQNQFQSVLRKLQELNFCNSKDEAIYFYSVLVDYLRKKVVNNPPDQVSSRQVTKNELLNYLNKGRKVTFLSSYKEYRGEQEYFKFLKSRFKKPIKNQNTIIFFGDLVESDSCNLQSLVHQIVKNHYHRATHDVKPLIFIIPDEKIIEVKSYLIKENCLLNDGYETILFNQKYFESPPIINKKMSGGKLTSSLSKTSFEARIISNLTLDKITELNLNVSWIFIDSEKHKLLCDSTYQTINNLNTEQLLKLF
ncbi:hypothetical protein ACFQ0I_05845 [Mariniflexile aquimaris]|uniref:DUF4297 domain-containing protein n=1 Tax=Mariniflexile aquimaris TaxID=881009 RepID=A0ABW3BRL4_9FLAO